MVASFHTIIRIAVDRSLDPRHDDVVIVSLDGELTCKRLLIRGGRMIIAPDSDDHSFRMVDITGRPDVEAGGRRHRTIVVDATGSPFAAVHDTLRGDSGRPGVTPGEMTKARTMLGLGSERLPQEGIRRPRCWMG